MFGSDLCNKLENINKWSWKLKLPRLTQER